MTMHKLSPAPLKRSKHDPFSYAIMLCDPEGGGMGTDHTDRVDCVDCLRLMVIDVAKENTDALVRITRLAGQWSSVSNDIRNTVLRRPAYFYAEEIAKVLGRKSCLR